MINRKFAGFKENTDLINDLIEKKIISTKDAAEILGLLGSYASRNVFLNNEQISILLRTLLSAPSSTRYNPESVKKALNVFLEKNEKELIEEPEVEEEYLNRDELDMLNNYIKEYIAQNISRISINKNGDPEIYGEAIIPENLDMVKSKLYVPGKIGEFSYLKSKYEEEFNNLFQPEVRRLLHNKFNEKQIDEIIYALSNAVFEERKTVLTEKEREVHKKNTDDKQETHIMNDIIDKEYGFYDEVTYELFDVLKKKLNVSNINWKLHLGRGNKPSTHVAVSMSKLGSRFAKNVYSERIGHTNIPVYVGKTNQQTKVLSDIWYTGHPQNQDQLNNIFNLVSQSGEYYFTHNVYAELCKKAGRNIQKAKFEEMSSEFLNYYAFVPKFVLYEIREEKLGKKDKSIKSNFYLEDRHDTRIKSFAENLKLLKEYSDYVSFITGGEKNIYQEILDISNLPEIKNKKTENSLFTERYKYLLNNYSKDFNYTQRNGNTLKISGIFNFLDKALDVVIDYLKKKENIQSLNYFGKDNLQFAKSMLEGLVDWSSYKMLRLQTEETAFSLTDASDKSGDGDDALSSIDMIEKATQGREELPEANIRYEESQEISDALRKQYANENILKEIREMKEDVKQCYVKFNNRNKAFFIDKMIETAIGNLEKVISSSEISMPKNTDPSSTEKNIVWQSGKKKGYLSVFIDNTRYKNIDEAVKNARIHWEGLLEGTRTAMYKSLSDVSNIELEVRKMRNSNLSQDQINDYMSKAISEKNINKDNIGLLKDNDIHDILNGLVPDSNNYDIKYIIPRYYDLAILTNGLQLIKTKIADKSFKNDTDEQIYQSIKSYFEQNAERINKEALDMYKQDGGNKDQEFISIKFNSNDMFNVFGPYESLGVLLKLDKKQSPSATLLNIDKKINSMKNRLEKAVQLKQPSLANINKTINDWTKVFNSSIIDDINMLSSDCLYNSLKKYSPQARDMFLRITGIGSSQDKSWNIRNKVVSAYNKIRDIFFKTARQVDNIKFINSQLIKLSYKSNSPDILIDDIINKAKKQVKLYRRIL